MAKKILVVEDGADVPSVVVALLTRICGYEAIEAANGNEAVAKALSEEPDLILMDVSLPDISPRAELVHLQNLALTNRSCLPFMVLAVTIY